MLKRGLLSFLFLLIGFSCFAQTGNSANPYSTHPYQSSPYTDPNQKDDNFLKRMDDGQEGDDKKGKEGNTDPEKKTLTKEQAELLKDNNVNPEELFLKDGDYQKYLGQNENIYFQKSDSLDEEKRLARNTKEIDTTELGKIRRKNRIYGANFFRNNVFELSDKLSNAPPMDYRLGPGDELILSIWGDAELQASFTIANDGSIFPNKVGKIHLNGLTFEEASQLITARFRKVIPNNSHVDIQMGRSRLIRITIEGEVEKPGTYSISAFNTAVNALFKAGGLTELGNLRKIEVKRQGRTIEVIDLYEYLQKGKFAEEFYLEDNDYIYVDVYEKLVQAEGNFKRPMFYQLTSEEGLYDLVQLAGGPSFNARKSQIQIKTIALEEEHYINIPGYQILDKNSEDDYVLKDGDVITLKPVNTGLQNIVRIEGAVNYPDEYEVKQGERLKQILDRAGGLKSDAYLPKAFVFRGQNQLESNAIKLDLRDLEAGSRSNILIQKGDKIKILSNSSFDEKFKIAVRGYVRKPGDFAFHNNLTLKDLLLLAGGLTLDAENGRIEISNIVDSLDKYTLSNSNGANIKIISINANLEIDEVSEKIIIKPMDRIYVRKKAEFLPMNRVVVAGEVSYPGEYVFNKNERIAAVVKRAGGLNDNAFANGAKLYRKGTGIIVIDLPMAIKNPDSKYDLVLSDSDVLVIPTINDIVSLRGEVQSQVNVKFDKDNQSIKYYIASAGGFGNDPWKNRINVKYQNGRIKSTKTFLGVRRYPKIKEGCTIVVPRKPVKVNKTKFSEVLTYALSTLTTLATLVVLAKTLK
ncbi:MAG: SLBB domain-containing protein [Chitinophagaceae bacterium]|nr:SLBB domain-containing protein [Chitinophagaceae bacterium]